MSSDAQELGDCEMPMTDLTTVFESLIRDADGVLVSIKEMQESVRNFTSHEEMEGDGSSISGEST